MVTIYDSFEDINKAKLAYAASILEYLASVKDEWKELPALTKAIDGITGYNDQYGICYKENFWRIWKAFNGYYVLGIDCNTGQLKRLGFRDTEDLDDANIEDWNIIAEIEPDYFDVEKIKQYLKNKNV